MVRAGLGGGRGWGWFIGLIKAGMVGWWVSGGERGCVVIVRGSGTGLGTGSGAGLSSSCSSPISSDFVEEVGDERDDESLRSVVPSEMDDKYVSSTRTSPWWVIINCTERMYFENFKGFRPACQRGPASPLFKHPVADFTD